MANSHDVGLGKRGANLIEKAQNFAHANFVIGNGLVHIDDLLAVLVLDVALGFADALNQALGDRIAVLGVDELILD